MKELADGTQVTSRSFYFLLDWNDRNNWQVMHGLYGQMKLSQLCKHQYVYLFKKAMASEVEILENA